jgi:hypothetical protein
MLQWNNFCQMLKAKNTFYEDIVINTEAKEKQWDFKQNKKSCEPNKVVNKIQNKITRL